MRLARTILAGPRWRTILLVFLAVVVCYEATFSFRQRTDTRVNSFQTRALVLHGDVDLTRYRDELPNSFVVRRGDRLYSIYGLGISLVSAPFYAALVHAGANEAILQGTVAVAFAAAAAVVLLVLLVRLVGPAVGAAAAGVFAFGTTMWPTGATALWQHAPAALFQILGLGAFFSRSKRAPQLAGLALGTATFIRPTMAILGIVVGAVYLFEDRRALLRYGLAALIPLLGVPIQNQWMWSSWTHGGYQNAHIGFHADIPRALFGLFFGWWRGLLPYSPALVLAVPGLIGALRRRAWVDRRLIACAVGSLITIGMYARWSTWWGGYNQFGYRYLLDIVPLLVILGAFAAKRSRVAAGVGMPLAAVSVATMIAASKDDFRGWDFTPFTHSLVRSPLGEAWDASLSDPAGFVARAIVTMAVIAFLFVSARALAAGSGSGQARGDVGV